MPFDPTKPIQTRTCLPARIICTDRLSETHPIVALIKTGDIEVVRVCTKAGQYISQSVCHDNDLVNISTKTWRWIHKTRAGDLRITDGWYSEERAQHIYKDRLVQRIDSTMKEE